MSISERLKEKLSALFRRKPASKGPLLPAGTVDTREFREELRKELHELDGLFAADPDAYRKMQLSAYYRKGHSPDFQERIPALMYKLRLCNLYLLHYYLMYRLLVPTLLREKIKDMRLLVLGCGSMIDALSLSYVLRETGGSPDVHYTGVDIAGWPTRVQVPFETRFVHKPLQEYWDGVDEFDGNILFFATVLSELREYPDDTGAFICGLEKTAFTSDVLFLLVSYRSTSSYKRDWKLTDWQKTQRVIGALERKGYQTESLPLSLPESWERYFHSEEVRDEGGKAWPCHYLASPDTEDGRIGLKELAPDFAVPDFVQAYLDNPGNIRKHCPYYPARREQDRRRNPDREAGEENLARICRAECPITCNPLPRDTLSNKFSPCFQIFIFRRKHEENV